MSAVTASPVAAANPSTPYASASLYVGDLTSDVTEALLFEIFNAVGPVASVRVCRDAATRRSLGYAYVNFHRVEDAERALDTMNFKAIRNRACRIMWSHRDPALRKSGLGNIFVNHLAKSIDNKQLSDTFSMFGNILSCKVSANSKRESLGYGFVHYETEESALTAIAKVDGKVIAGEKVSVTAFKSKKERGTNNKFKYTNVFVKNLPAEVSKEEVEELFSKHGVVTSSVITVDNENKSRSFGFVNYSAPEEATLAVENLNNFEFQGKKLYVSRAQKKEEREKELRERFEQLKQERAKKYAGVNLYVKNLSDETDDAKLTSEFGKFGSITSAKVMRDGAGKSRGFGFVCYSNTEEATKAVTEMNGRMIDSKPLYVALAQRKDARRQQLEAQYAARAKIGVPQAGVGPQLYPGQPGPLMFQGGILPPGTMNRNFMYPQQVMPPRWNPQQSPQMGGVGVNVGLRPGVGVGINGMPMNYQLMPVGAGGRVVPGQMGGVGMLPGVGVGVNGVQLNGRGGPGVGVNGVAGARGRPQRPGQPGVGVGQVGVGLGMKGGVGMQGQVGVGLPQQMLGQQQNISYNQNVRNRSAQALPQQSLSTQQVEQVVMPAPNEPLTIKALAAAPEEMRKQMIGERLFPLIKQQESVLAGKITGMLLEMDNGELIHLLESHQALNEKIQEALTVLHQHPQVEQQEIQQAGTTPGAATEETETSA